jgi:hypothetical protein
LTIKIFLFLFEETLSFFIKKIDIASFHSA